MGASGCTTNGAKLVVSAWGCASVSFCQCASGPSPRHETIPIPVIQTSRALSAIGRHLGREADSSSGFAHPLLHFIVGKIENAKRQCGIADRLAAERNTCVRDRIAGTLM